MSTPCGGRAPSPAISFSVILRDIRAGQLLPDILWLLVFTAVMLLIATKRFRKSLD
jgi:hypothetical protein